MKTKIEIVDQVISEINYAKKHIGLCTGAGFDSSLELALCDLQEALKFLNIIKEQLKDSE